MSVYTKFSVEELTSFLKNYPIGGIKEITPIAEGVINSNYFVHTEHHKYVLTFIEEAFTKQELVNLYYHIKMLNQHGICAPIAIPHHNQQEINLWCDKFVVLISFLEGKALKPPFKPESVMKAAECLAKIHLIPFNANKPVRENTFSYQKSLLKWEVLLTKSDLPLLFREGLTAEFAYLKPFMIKASSLESGFIHADYFPDNIFFDEQGAVTGVIDYYFGCYGSFLLDVAIMVNAWCFNKDNKLDQALFAACLEGYQNIRPLTALEQELLPQFLRFAALRFTLSRLYDQICVPPMQHGVKKDPNEFLHRLLCFQNL